MDDPNIWNNILTGLATAWASMSTYISWKIKKELTNPTAIGLTEQEVKTLIADKIGAVENTLDIMREQITHIDTKQDKIYEYLLNAKNTRR